MDAETMGRLAAGKGDVMTDEHAGVVDDDGRGVANDGDGGENDVRSGANIGSDLANDGRDGADTEYADLLGFDETPDGGYDEKDGEPDEESEAGNTTIGVGDSAGREESAGREDLVIRRPNRPKPLVAALIAVFAAGLVFAGWAVTRSILDARARDHATALADCRAARARYTETLTGYTPTARKAATLLKDTASVAGSDTRDRLQAQLDSLTDADVAGPAKRDCATDLSRSDLDDLGDRYATATSMMNDGLISIRYDVTMLQQMKDGLNAQDVRKRLSGLVTRGELAYSRSAGKADETLRATLRGAIDAAKQALADTPSDRTDAVAARVQPLSEATDAVIAAMPLDCHFADCVALTFDDGPNKEVTPQVLDALKKAGVPATFFLQGQFVSGSNVKLVKRMAAEGHSVGSMSWRHTQMHAMPADQLAKWFKDTDAVISPASGKPVTLFRPPDGAWSDALRDQAKASGQAMILWGVDSGDWGKLDSAQIEKRVLDNAYAGSIIALHDGNAATATALPKIIDGLKQKGYHIVTVDTLLAGDIQPGSVAYGLNDVQ